MSSLQGSFSVDRCSVTQPECNRLVHLCHFCASVKGAYVSWMTCKNLLRSWRGFLGRAKSRHFQLDCCFCDLVPDKQMPYRHTDIQYLYKTCHINVASLMHFRCTLKNDLSCIENSTGTPEWLHSCISKHEPYYIIYRQGQIIGNRPWKILKQKVH